MKAPPKGHKPKITVLEFSSPFCVDCAVTTPVIDYLEKRCSGASFAEIGESEMSANVALLADPPKCTSTADTFCGKFKAWTEQRTIAPGARIDPHPLYLFDDEDAYERFTYSFLSDQDSGLSYPMTVILVNGKPIYNSQSRPKPDPIIRTENGSDTDAWRSAQADRAILRIQEEVRKSDPGLSWSCKSK